MSSATAATAEGLTKHSLSDRLFYFSGAPIQRRRRSQKGSRQKARNYSGIFKAALVKEKLSPSLPRRKRRFAGLIRLMKG
jgi:hypothetical protein